MGSHNVHASDQREPSSAQPGRASQSRMMLFQAHRLRPRAAVKAAISAPMIRRTTGSSVDTSIRTSSGASRFESASHVSSSVTSRRRWPAYDREDSVCATESPAGVSCHSSSLARSRRAAASTVWSPAGVVRVWSCMKGSAWTRPKQLPQNTAAQSLHAQSATPPHRFWHAVGWSAPVLCRSTACRSARLRGRPSTPVTGTPVSAAHTGQARLPRKTAEGSCRCARQRSMGQGATCTPEAGAAPQWRSLAGLA
jgi:hypothetical protein